ncbi:hypothetical protein JUM41_24920 [Rhizobium pusense]|uniref:hypothetical protein n=1 Tax=Agrobacterium pusense TaxID=648995 RepID=UPI001FCDE276|nr:hypothetical protein [Agrobacterium pusense]MCJ2877491.1 hypothetical protein [Agrobacterium pusense]
MSPELKKQLRDFESQLDEALDALPSLRWASTSALRMASELYEIGAIKNGIDSVGYIDRGYSILASHLVAGVNGYRADVARETDLQQMINDLAFASHYYMIREYLYYSYNVPGSMSWSFADGRVEIRFGDKSIPRQFFTVHNDQLLGSQYHFRDFNHSEEIVRLLKDEPEGVITPNFEAADPLMRQEADLKLAAYFSLIPPDSQIDLGGYTYQQFFNVYRMLLTKALYHRYLARAQDAVGAIYMPEQDLLAGIQEELGIAPDTAQRILQDLVYDRNATAGKVDASCFSLTREGETGGRIVMRPHHFAIAEGLANMLRVIAQRRPNTFLEQVSNEIGSAFVRRVKAAWEAEGFICHSEVSLREFDATLPDIDLLVISVEPTLGYVIFVCELKCPVPPRWAKDQLKVLNKDSVSKAFRQVEVLRRFIRTEGGLRLLSRMLPKEGHPNFEGFAVTLDHLVITSDNAGMFFGSESTKVINFRTLERLLRRSDGDMALIQHVLETYNEHADEALVTTMAEFQVGSLAVAYEGVTASALLEFPQGNWRSSAERQEMIDAFVADGLHPFDVFEHRPPDVVVVDHSEKSGVQT